MPRDVIDEYVIAYERILSVAPKAIINGFKKIRTRIQMITPEMSRAEKAVPANFLAFSSFF